MDRDESAVHLEHKLALTEHQVVLLNAKIARLEAELTRLRVEVSRLKPAKDFLEWLDRQRRETPYDSH